MDLATQEAGGHVAPLISLTLDVSMVIVYFLLYGETPLLPAAETRSHVGETPLLPAAETRSHVGACLVLVQHPNICQQYVANMSLNTGICVIK